MCLINMYFHWTTFQGMQHSLYLLTRGYRQPWASLSCLIYPVSAESLQQKKPSDFRSEASPFLCKLDFLLKVKCCVHRTDFQMCAVLLNKWSTFGFQHCMHLSECFSFPLATQSSGLLCFLHFVSRWLHFSLSFHPFFCWAYLRDPCQIPSQRNIDNLIGP